MINIILNLLENVLGISADGDITRDDYKNVLIPEIRKMLKVKRKIKLLYFLGNDFTGFDLNVILKGKTKGLKHCSCWKKVALVLEEKYMTLFAAYYGDLLNNEIKLFSEDNIEKAKIWITE